MIVSVGLLGGLEVRADEGRITGAHFASRKARQVFAMLVLAQGRTLSKYEIVDTVWRRRMPQNPASTVEVSVSLARAALKEIHAEHILVTEPGGYRIDTDLTVVDIISFDELLAIAARMPEADRMPPLREALALVRGPLLQDEEASDWVLNHRDRYQQRVHSARLGLATAALAHGDLEAAVRAAEEAWLGSDLVLEEAYVVAVRALLALGRVTEARAVHGAAVRRLTTEEQRLPGADLAALELALQPRSVAPMVRTPVSVDRAYASLSSPVPFLGRSQELEQLDRAIGRALDDGHTVAVEVVGPAGLGRSRLLQEAAQRRSGPKVVLTRCLPGDDQHPLLATSRLVRSIAQAAQVPPPAMEESVTTMFGRLTELFDRLGPTAVLIDDLHRADAATLALWRSLVEPGGASGLCVVAAAPRRCWEWAADGESRVVVGPLAPLTEADVDVLGVDAAWADTGGNPTVLDVLVTDAPQRTLTDEGVRRIDALVGSLGPQAADALAEVSTARSFATSALVRPGLDEVAAEVLVLDALALGLVRRTRSDRWCVSAATVGRVLQSVDRAVL